MRRPLPLLSPSVLPLPLTLLLMHLAIIPVEAQVQAPACLPAAMEVWNWTYNSLNQSPCQTAAYLAAQCNDGQFTIPSLANGSHYTGPSGPEAGDMCRCNSVYYSLISACVGCQKGRWISYDQWYANCTKVAPISTFPKSITNDTRVPAWAFFTIPNIFRPWDNVTACEVGDNPESTGSSRPPFAPAFDSAQAVRVGVVVALASISIILAFALLGIGAWFFLRRYRRPRRPDSGVQSESASAEPRGSERESGGRAFMILTLDIENKLYNPSDPNTHPIVRVLPTGTLHPSTINSATRAKDPTAAKKLRPTEYSGLPEV